MADPRGDGPCPDLWPDEPILVLHPSPAASRPARGRRERPFLERLRTPARIGRAGPGSLLPVPDPTSAGRAVLSHGGWLWLSLSARSRPGGPRTAVTPGELAAFLAHPGQAPSLAGLLRGTPLVAAYGEGEDPGGDMRGAAPPEGHVVSREERDRSAAAVRDFLAREMLVDGERAYVRAHPAYAVGRGGVAATLLPDPALDGVVVLPAAAVADLRAPGPAPSRKEAARAAARARQPAEEARVLMAAANLLGRSALGALAVLDRPGEGARVPRERVRDGLLGSDPAWTMRCRLGGMDLADGEALSVRAAAAARGIAGLEPFRRPERARTIAAFAKLALLAEAALLPRLRHGSPPSSEDLAALDLL